MTVYAPHVVREICGKSRLVMHAGELEKPHAEMHWEGETPFLFGYVRNSLAFRLLHL
jgi:hypothetical protein